MKRHLEDYAAMFANAYEQEKKMKKFIYLAGPILDCTEGEANDWRKTVAEALAPHGLVGISPLRCEPLHGERYLANYPDPKFGTSKAIAAKNKYDVATCDLVFAYLPKTFIKDMSLATEHVQVGALQKRGSIGTILEIGWASSQQHSKPVILITDDEFIINHPVMAACNGWCLPTLDDGIEVAIGLLAGYTGGKNV